MKKPVESMSGDQFQILVDVRREILANSGATEERWETIDWICKAFNCVVLSVEGVHLIRKGIKSDIDRSLQYEETR